MKKYEVKKFDVEANLYKDTDEQAVWEKWFDKTNQTMELVAAFDTLEEAKKFYENVKLAAPKRVGCAGINVGFEGKVIEENEYDEDGEWIGGGDWWMSEIRVDKVEEEDEEDD